MVLFIEKRLSTVNKLDPRERKTEDQKLRIANYAFGSDKEVHPFLKEVIKRYLHRLSLILRENPENITDLDIVWIYGPDVITIVYHNSKHKYNDLLLLKKNNLKHQSFEGWRQ